MNDLLHFPFRSIQPPVVLQDYAYRKVIINDKYPIWSCRVKLMVGDRVIVRKLHSDKKNWVGTVTRCLEYADKLELEVKNIILEKADDDKTI